MRLRSHCWNILIAFIVVVLSGLAGRHVIAQEQAPSVALPPPPSSVTVSEVSLQPTDEAYRIGPGDLIDIIVSKNEILSRNAIRVSNSGFIQVPMFDKDVQAACKTERELADEIRARYLRYMRNPHVYVAVKEYNSKPVAVIGAVNSPGRFQLQRRVRLLELLTFVNGPSDRAGRSVQIIHTGVQLCGHQAQDVASDDLAESFNSYNLKDTLMADERSNPIVLPGDIVRIAEAEQVYVIGSVKTSLTIPLREPVTISQAIARAGGALPDAQTDKVRIIRQSPGTLNKTEIIVNLKAINKRQKEDLMLEANDVVDVPGPSGARRFLNGLIDRATSMSSLPLRVIP